MDGHFPVSNAMMELARDDAGTIIGVTIHSLILTKNVHELPELFKKIAHGLLYEHATR
jgi:hypothetical protein